MNKEKVIEIFNELLEAWEVAEGDVIHYSGDAGDFEQLRQEKRNFEERFREALNS